MNLSNLNIGTRLALGFGVVLILLMLVLGIGLINLSSINDSVVKIVESNNVKVDAGNNMRDAQRQAAIAIRNIVLLSDDLEMAEQRKNISAAWERYSKGADILQQLVETDAGKAVLTKIAVERNAMVPLMDKVIMLGVENKVEEARNLLLKEVAPGVIKWQAALQDMIDLQAVNNKASADDAATHYSRSRLLMIGLGTLAIALGVLIAWLVTRSITRPLNEAVKVAQTVASGDLTSRIEVNSKDETGQLLQALQDMNSSLQDIVGQVRSGTDTISTAANEIAVGNADLSSRTEQQASSLEETASSMEELTSTVKQNADNARQANQLAVSASGIAEKGGAVVQNVVVTMAAINESARKIADIISVIDGIAFQTNILALNAAVEAARAGEQGRGFAVVAAEVRNLAQRSASAAKEIKTLITDSAEKVDSGNKLVDEAGTTMQEIVQAIKRVTDLMAEIAAASEEQSSGIEQINSAVTQMDEVTQQNAALVEEASAAAESLRQQSQELMQTVSVFTLSSGTIVKSDMRGANITRVMPKQIAKAPLAKPKQPKLKAAKSAQPVDDEWNEF